MRFCCRNGALLAEFMHGASKRASLTRTNRVHILVLVGLEPNPLIAIIVKFLRKCLISTSWILRTSLPLGSSWRFGAFMEDGL